MSTTVTSPVPVSPLVAQVITPASQTLLDGVTIAIDASLGEVCKVQIAGNRTLSNPTSGIGGQGLTVIVQQDATGNRTLAFDTMFSFVGMATPVVNPTASAKTVLEFIFDAESAVYRCIGSTAPNNSLNQIGTVTVTLQGLYAAGAAVTTRTDIPVWRNMTGRSVRIESIRLRQCGEAEFASDANDTYVISIDKTGAVSIVASVLFDAALVLPLFTVQAALTVITAGAANVLATADDLLVSFEIDINDAAKIAPFCELQINYTIL